jgi:hypothetical protein
MLFPVSSFNQFSPSKMDQKERIVKKFEDDIILLLNEFKSSTIIDNKESIMKNFIKFIEIEQKKEDIILTKSLIEIIPQTSKPLIILNKNSLEFKLYR